MSADIIPFPRPEPGDRPDPLAESRRRWMAKQRAKLGMMQPPEPPEPPEAA